MRAMFGVRGNASSAAGSASRSAFLRDHQHRRGDLAANALLGISACRCRRRRVDRARRGRALSFVLSVYGHATILKLAPVFSARSPWLRGAGRVRARRADSRTSRRPMPVADTGRWCCSATRSSRGPAVVGHRRRLRPLPAGAHLEAGGRLVDGARRLHPGRAHRQPRRDRATAIDMTDPQLTIGEIVPGVVHADLPRDRRARQHHEQRARRVLHRPLRAGSRLPRAAPPRS